jgi:hypothetical protein
MRLLLFIRTNKHCADWNPNSLVGWRTTVMPEG